MTQQLREATAWGEGPRFLIRDHDDKFGTRFDDVAEGTGITILRTPVRAPNANAVCERFLRSVRAEHFPAVGSTQRRDPYPTYSPMPSTRGIAVLGGELRDDAAHRQRDAGQRLGASPSSSTDDTGLPRVYRLDPSELPAP